MFLLHFFLQGGKKRGTIISAGVQNNMSACEAMRRPADWDAGEKIDFWLLSPQKQLQKPVTGCYCLDLSLTISCIQVCFLQAPTTKWS